MSGAPVTLSILIANVAFSLFAFSDQSALFRFDFHVKSILQGREWHRLLSSGFLHVGVSHLLVNMLTLYFCGPALEKTFGMHAELNNGGPLPYIILYLGSLLGGNGLGLLIHRDQPNYRAVGASGAISGLIFAIAVISPQTVVQVFFILPMPLWLFAILYVAISLFGMRSSLGNIGHSAHLGGAIVGMFITMAFFPEKVVENWVFLTLLLVPTLFVLVLIVLRPDLADNMTLLFRSFFQGNFGRKKRYKPRHDHDVSPRILRQAEMDAILDKIRKHGIASLTKEEKQFLDEFSRRGRTDDSD
jgi:membrane associated rhomboid family serine protease